MLLGPTFTAEVKAYAGVEDAIATAFAGDEGGEPLPELRHRIFESQVAVISEHVRMHAVEHDGYHTEWEGLGLDLEDAGVAMVSVGINVICKDEDADAFDRLLSSDAYVGQAKATLRSVLVAMLTKAGVDGSRCEISIDADGFGYG